MWPEKVLQQSVHSSAQHGGNIDDINEAADVDDWQTRAIIDANTNPVDDDELAALSDLMPSPDQLDLEQLDQFNQDQMEQWTLPLMLQLDDHQSSHSTSLC